MNGSSLNIFSKQQTATLRSEGERRHSWNGGMVFSVQFEESSFDMFLSQQILSTVVGEGHLREKKVIVLERWLLWKGKRV